MGYNEVMNSWVWLCLAAEPPGWPSSRHTESSPGITEAETAGVELGAGVAPAIRAGAVMVLGDGDELGTGEAGDWVGLAGGGLAGEGDVAGLGLAPAGTDTGVTRVASGSTAWWPVTQAHALREHSSEALR